MIKQMKGENKEAKSLAVLPLANTNRFLLPLHVKSKTTFIMHVLCKIAKASQSLHALLSNH